MARANLLDPKVRAAKKRKQAIVLGVFFVAVLAFSVPKTMKMMNQSAPTSTPSSESASDGSSTASTPSAAGSAQAVAASSGDTQVVDADLAPPPLEGQLVDFTAFDAKDPFVQQKVATSGFKSTASASASQSPASTQTAKQSRGVVETTKPAATSEGSSPTQPSTSGGTSTSTAAPAAQPTAATISVNGVQESVSVGTDFPAATPTFRLVKLTTKTASISIAGGTLASGAPAVTLQLAKPLTLMNTADGTRYVLILVSTGSAPATGTSTSSP